MSDNKKSIFDYRNTCANECNTILNTPPNELTEDLQKRMDHLLAEIDKCDRQVRLVDVFGAAQTRAQEAVLPPNEPPPGLENATQHRDDHLGMSKKEVADYSINRVYRYLVSGKRSDAPHELDVSDTLQKRDNEYEGHKNIPSGGVRIPADALIPRYARMQEIAPLQTRALTLGTSGSPGPGWYASLEQPRGFIDMVYRESILGRLGVTQLNGLGGGALTFAKQNARTAAYWVAEGIAPPQSNVTTGTIRLEPKTLRAWSTITDDMIKQDSFDMEALTTRDLLITMGLEIERVIFHGSPGSGQPQGLLTNGGLTLKAMGTNGAPLNWNALVDIRKTVAKKDYPLDRLKIASTYDVEGALASTLKFPTTSTSPAILSEFGGRVANFPFIPTNAIRSDYTKGSGSNLSGFVIGDFSELLVANWGSLTLVKDEKHDISTGTIAIASYMTMGTLVRRPDAFVISQDVAMV